jgi:hypothetical protein
MALRNIEPRYFDQEQGMNSLAEAIVQELIFRPQTSARLARIFDLTEEAMQALVLDLCLEGRIAPSASANSAWGDVRCAKCHQEFEREYDLPRPPCSCCGGYLEDICLWSYVGGPISEALAAAA